MGNSTSYNIENSESSNIEYAKLLQQTYKLEEYGGYTVFVSDEKRKSDMEFIEQYLG